MNKDGAYYCYCACVLRISRLSGFLWVVPTYTPALKRFKTIRRKQDLTSALGIPQEIGGSHAFFRDNKATI